MLLSSAIASMHCVFPMMQPLRAKCRFVGVVWRGVCVPHDAAAEGEVRVCGHGVAWCVCAP
jgi:hypothetical protein